MLQKTKAEMYPLIAAWQKSNMQQKEFCEQHQLRLHTFSYWLQKYKKEQKGEETGEHQSAFIPLEVSKPVGQVLGELEVQYPNGINLRFSSLPSVSYLSTLLKRVT